MSRLEVLENVKKHPQAGETFFKGEQLKSLSKEELIAAIAELHELFETSINRVRLDRDNALRRQFG